VKAMTIIAAVCSFDTFLGCLSEGAEVKFVSPFSEFIYGQLNRYVSRILHANTRLRNFIRTQIWTLAETRVDSGKKLYKEKRN